eukprot:PhF_6_TR26614/c0_g1_i1/m.38519
MGNMPSQAGFPERCLLLNPLSLPLCLNINANGWVSYHIIDPDKKKDYGYCCFVPMESKPDDERDEDFSKPNSMLANRFCGKDKNEDEIIESCEACKTNRSFEEYGCPFPMEYILPPRLLPLSTIQQKPIILLDNSDLEKLLSLPRGSTHGRCPLDVEKFYVGVPTFRWIPKTVIRDSEVSRTIPEALVQTPSFATTQYVVRNVEGNLAFLLVQEDGPVFACGRLLDASQNDIKSYCGKGGICGGCKLIVENGSRVTLGRRQKPETIFSFETKISAGPDTKKYAFNVFKVLRLRGLVDDVSEVVLSFLIEYTAQEEFDDYVKRGFIRQPDETRKDDCVIS